MNHQGKTVSGKNWLVPGIRIVFVVLLPVVAGQSGNVHAASTKMPPSIQESAGRWLDVRMALDCGRQRYGLYVNGKEVDDNIKFGEKVETLERLVFRTGPWRGCVWPFIVDRQPATKGLYAEDLLGTDDKSSPSVYLIDDVRTKN
jgi:hypothetical protein